MIPSRLIPATYREAMALLRDLPDGHPRRSAAGDVHRRTVARQQVAPTPAIRAALGKALELQVRLIAAGAGDLN